MKLQYAYRSLIPAACAALLLQSAIHAQSVPPSGIVQITVSPADKQAVKNASNLSTHPLWRPGVVHKTSTPTAAATPAATANVVTTPQGFFPGDASYFGGQVLTTAISHPLYVDCGPNCWGDPATFLTNFQKSSMIHITDQYVGASANNRYTVGTAAIFSYPAFAPLGDNDILQILHAGAFQFGTGYGHVYHMFLAPGIDVCFTGSSECYSPDNPSTFFFCAYHGSVTFSDIGHVLYTVEPYQNVPGCAVQQPSPNGPLVDSTANILSHELTETITDPDGDAWFVYNDLSLIFQEIGDECEQSFFSYPAVTLNSKPYAIQPEYANDRHKCSYTP